jgi:hypothetical protein
MQNRPLLNSLFTSSFICQLILISITKSSNANSIPTFPAANHKLEKKTQLCLHHPHAVGLQLLSFFTCAKTKRFRDHHPQAA